MVTSRLLKPRNLLLRATGKDKLTSLTTQRQYTASQSLFLKPPPVILIPIQLQCSGRRHKQQNLKLKTQSGTIGHQTSAERPVLLPCKEDGAKVWLLALYRKLATSSCMRSMMIVEHPKKILPQPM